MCFSVYKIIEKQLVNWEAAEAADYKINFKDRNIHTKQVQPKLDFIIGNQNKKDTTMNSVFSLQTRIANI